MRLSAKLRSLKRGPMKVAGTGELINLVAEPYYGGFIPQLQCSTGRHVANTATVSQTLFSCLGGVDDPLWNNIVRDTTDSTKRHSWRIRSRALKVHLHFNCAGPSDQSPAEFAVFDAEDAICRVRVMIAWMEYPIGQTDDPAVDEVVDFDHPVDVATNYVSVQHDFLAPYKNSAPQGLPPGVASYTGLRKRKFHVMFDRVINFRKHPINNNSVAGTISNNTSATANITMQANPPGVQVFHNSDYNKSMRLFLRTNRYMSPRIDATDAQDFEWRPVLMWWAQNSTDSKKARVRCNLSYEHFFQDDGNFVHGT